MPTGDAEFPKESSVRITSSTRAPDHDSVASGTVRDNDLEDTVIDILSDNIPAVGTKRKWGREAHQDRASLPAPACPSKADI